MVTSNDIADITVVGKALITAGDTTAGRAAIGAGTSNLAIASTAPAALGATAAVGSGTTAARADHVHPYPTAAQVGAAPASHTHTTAQVTGLVTELAAKINKSSVESVTPIADPAAATVEDVATAFNALLAALNA